MSALLERIAAVRAVGTLAWIGVRPGHDVPMRALERASVSTGRGIEGDRATKGAIATGKRHVTLIQAEHLPVIAARVLEGGAIALGDRLRVVGPPRPDGIAL